MAAVVGAYEAALAGHQKKLSKGERGLVPCLARLWNPALLFAANHAVHGAEYLLG
jgi:hypothetical protein